MRDSEARAVINLLTKRLQDLRKDIDMMQKPHPKTCKCNYCEGWTPDNFIVDLVSSHGGGYATWWKR